MSELEQYKARVLEVAKRVKREEGWCDSGFLETMRELDIEVPPERYEMEIYLKVRVYATCTDVGHEVDEDFIVSSMQSAYVDLDSDWEDVDVDGYDVESVQFELTNDR